MGIDDDLLREAERAARYAVRPALLPITGREAHGSGPGRHYILDTYQSLFLRSLSGCRLFSHEREPDGPDGGIRADWTRRYVA